MKNLQVLIFPFLISLPFFIIFFVMGATVYKDNKHVHKWHWVHPKGADYEAAIDKAHSRASARTQGKRRFNFEYYMGLEMERLGWHKQDWSWCCEEGE